MYRWGYGGYGRLVDSFQIGLSMFCEPQIWILIFGPYSFCVQLSNYLFFKKNKIKFCRLGHREQKDEFAPRRVDIFTNRNVLPPDAIISAGSVNSACTAGMQLCISNTHSLVLFFKKGSLI